MRGNRIIYNYPALRVSDVYWAYTLVSAHV